MIEDLFLNDLVVIGGPVVPLPVIADAFRSDAKNPQLNELFDGQTIQPGVLDR